MTQEKPDQKSLIEQALDFAEVIKRVTELDFRSDGEFSQKNALNSLIDGVPRAAIEALVQKISDDIDTATKVQIPKEAKQAGDFRIQETPTQKIAELKKQLELLQHLSDSKSKILQDSLSQKTVEIYKGHFKMLEARAEWLIENPKGHALRNLANCIAHFKTQIKYYKNFLKKERIENTSHETLVSELEAKVITLEPRVRRVLENHGY